MRTRGGSFRRAGGKSCDCERVGVASGVRSGTRTRTLALVHDRDCCSAGVGEVLQVPPAAEVAGVLTTSMDTWGACWPMLQL